MIIQVPFALWFSKHRVCPSRDSRCAGR